MRGRKRAAQQSSRLIPGQNERAERTTASTAYASVTMRFRWLGADAAHLRRHLVPAGEQLSTERSAGEAAGASDEHAYREAA